MGKEIVIESFLINVFNLELDIKRANGYELIEAMPYIDYGDKKLYRAKLRRKIDLKFKAFGM